MKTYKVEKYIWHEDNLSQDVIDYFRFDENVSDFSRSVYYGYDKNPMGKFNT